MDGDYKSTRDRFILKLDFTKTHLSTFFFIIFMKCSIKVFPMNFPDIYIKTFQYRPALLVHHTEIEYWQIMESILNVYIRKVSVWFPLKKIPKKNLQFV